MLRPYPIYEILPLAKNNDDGKVQQFLSGHYKKDTKINKNVQ